MPQELSDIVVDVLGERFALGDVSIDLFPKSVFQWELGGITDPIGQLFGWLWSQIQGAINYLGETVWGHLRTVRDYLVGIFQSLISGISGSITSLYSMVSSVAGSIGSVTGFLSSVISTITSSISGISGTLAGFGSWLQSIYSSISGLGSMIIGSISGVVSQIQGWITTAIGTISATVSQVASVVTNVASAIGGLVNSMTAAIANVGTTIVTSISSTLTSIGSVITTGFSSVTSFLSNVGQTLAVVATTMSQILVSLGGQIWEGLSGLKTWFSDVIKNIAVTVTQLGTNLTTFLATLPQKFSDLWAWLEGGWNQFKQDMGVWWGDAQKWWDQTVKNTNQAVTEIQFTLGGFINPLINIGNLFDQFVKGVIAFIKDPWTTLGKVLTDALKAIGIDLVPITKAIDELRTGFIDFLKDPWTTLGKVLTDALKAVGIDLTPISKAIEAIREGFTEFFKDPSKALSNAIMGFVEWGKKEVLPKIISTLSGVYDWITSALSMAWKGLTDLSTKVWNFITTGLKSIIGTMGRTLVGVGEWFTNIMRDYFFTPFSKLPSMILGDFGKTPTAGVPTPENMLMNIATYMFGAFTAPYTISAFMMWVGDNTKLEFSLEPLGIGGRIPIKWGSVIKHLAKLVWRIPDILLGSLGYGFGIWISQPISRLVNANYRNLMPIEMPSLQEIRIMANRASVTTGFSQVMDTLKRFMSYYGFSDWSIDYNLGTVGGVKAPSGLTLSTTIKDRFGKPVVIPLDLRHAIPTGSELSRMMIRDVIIEFDDFATAMQVQGYDPDIARLYYLLHYRYPTPEHLWSLYRRGMSGMLWYQPAGVAYPEKKMGIGAEPIAPVTLNMNEAVFKTMMESYMKWHDYAPFAWSQGWTSDRYTIIDLMAEIPQRIDARWMYRFSVIEDGKTDGSVVKSVFNIVRARGVHPMWEEDVAVAECLNAFSEERSYARTGLMNVYEQGYSTETITDKTLENITTVPILGKERPIKFLLGERKLLLLRHNYDRGFNVLRGLWQHTTLALQRNMIDRPTVVELMKTCAAKMRSLSGLEFQIDEPFLNSWLEIFEIRRDFESIQRIRYWMRIFIYRATQLAESGEAFEKIVDEYAAKALLTPAEIEIMKSLGRAFIDAYKRNRTLSMIKNIVKGKIKRGDMTIEGGIAELVKAGMSKGEAEAYLESEVKPRVVSIDKLISMREYIPIDPVMLKKKMDAEGVPPDEQALYIPYSVATEISEEMGRVSTEIINDYVAGTIDETTMRQNLSALATLNGTAQQRLGVEWIALSPEERELLITIAKIRKARGVGVTEEGVVTGKFLTAERLASIMEYVPVSAAKFRETMQRENIPQDEQELRVAYGVASEIAEEVGKLVTELVTDFSKKMITETQLKLELDRLATLGGAVPQLLKIPWIVLSPQERSLIIALAKLRRARTK
jgi:phage-related protein